MYQPNDILLNKYRIDALAGQGAFAHVYRATHLSLNAPRALKVLRRDAPGIGSTEYADYRARFQLEARLGAGLDHPHVIRVYDFEQDGDVLILVMEYAAGGSLAERIAAAREAGSFIPIDEAVRIAREAAAGLAALHALDVVHRDVKPSNLLFDAQGRVKVSDLGLAQIPHGPSQRSLGGSLAVPHPGTPAYMSPEQQFTTAYLPPASDIYSLGVTLFELLTGRAYKNLKPGTRLSKVRWAAPAWLDEIAGRMLADEPRTRPWDGGEAAEALTAGWRTECDGRELILKLAPDLPLALVRVPAGEFLMGSNKAADSQAFDDELPQGRLSLPDHWIGKYPVTVAQFAAFVAATGYKTTAEQRGYGWNWVGREWKQIEGAHWRQPRGPESDVASKNDHPVTQVSWHDAAAFCEWAGRVTGRTVRLPTEAEWEKAASWRPGDPAARTPGNPGRKLLYPWGDEPPTAQLCNFNMNVGDTTPVGSYPAGASPCGALDMAGNVWEWTGSLWGTDWRKPTFGYPYVSGDGREDLAAGNDVLRVMRGGSWVSEQRFVRAAHRLRGNPEYRYDYLGFRCARS